MALGTAIRTRQQKAGVSSSLPSNGLKKNSLLKERKGGCASLQEQRWSEEFCPQSVLLEFVLLLMLQIIFQNDRRVGRIVMS